MTCTSNRYALQRVTAVLRSVLLRGAWAAPELVPSDQQPWITMPQAAATLSVSEMVVRRLIVQKSLPARQIVKFGPWMIERYHLDLPSVCKEIRRVHGGRRTGGAVSEKQTGAIRGFQ